MPGLGGPLPFPGDAGRQLSCLILPSAPSQGDGWLTRFLPRKPLIVWITTFTLFLRRDQNAQMVRCSNAPARDASTSSEAAITERYFVPANSRAAMPGRPEPLQQLSPWHRAQPLAATGDDRFSLTGHCWVARN